MIVDLRKFEEIIYAIHGTMQIRRSTIRSFIFSLSFILQRFGITHKGPDIVTFFLRMCYYYYFWFIENTLRNL